MAPTYATPGAGDSGARQKEHFGRNVPAELNNRRATAKQAPSEPPSLPVGKSSAAALSGLPRCEENDNYPTIARLNVHWRVVECKNSIQWILQRRQGKRWRGAWFCRTREALIRGAREYASPIGGDALVILLRLPERFPEGAS